MVSQFPPVLLLAGGLGTRIRSIAGDLPKAMVPVLGEPFIDRQLRLLHREGVSDVILCAAHQADVIQKYVGDGSRYGLNLSYSFDGDQLIGTGGAVQKASKLCSSPFAVLYGDSYLDVPFKPIYEAFVKSKKQGLMTVYRNENKLIPSNILYRDGNVVAYNKTNPGPEMRHVDFGLSMFEASAFDKFTHVPFDMSAVIDDLIARKDLAAFEVTQRFYEVGTPAGLRDLEEYIAGSTSAL